MSTVTINGRIETLPDDPEALLVDVVRDRMNLTGTKLVCGAGICGACTVLLDGVAVVSCLMPAKAVAGRNITTVEGIGGTSLHPVQRAFMALDALQCGFCTPGFLMLITGVLEREPDISDAELIDVLSSNLCRCTGYQNIVKAARAVAGEMRQRRTA